MADDQAIAPPRTVPTALQALIVLVAIVPLVALYVVIEGAFGLSRVMFIGFLWIFYWASILQLAPGGWLPSLAGSLVGIGLAGLLHTLPSAAGTGGIVVVAMLIAGAIYLLMRGQMVMLVNNATMLMLTVASSGVFTQPRDYVLAACSVVVASVYAGGLFLLPWLGARLGGLRAARRAAPDGVGQRGLYQTGRDR